MPGATRGGHRCGSRSSNSRGANVPRPPANGRSVPEDDEAFAIVTGTLRADAALTMTGVSLSVDVDSIADRRPDPGPLARRNRRQQVAASESARSDHAVSGGILVTVIGALAAERVDAWRAGRRIRMPVQLRRPSRYLDPDVPDFERALARRGTTLVGSVKSGALVEVLGRAGWIDETAGRVRAYARRAISRTVGSWSAQSAAIVAAIVIGDRAGLDDDVQRRLQEAGTYHVIAISGGNIAILAGLMLAGFRLAGMLGRVAMLSAIVVLLAYARLVGGGASVDRATLMAVTYFAARLVDQRSPPLNSLAFVAACLVAAQPLSVVDPAFILTFGATLAILWLVPVITTWTWPRFVVLAGGMLAASVATEIVLLPVGALVFSRVTFAGLALNFAAIPLMAVAQVAGMALVPAALVSEPAAWALGYVAHVAAAGLVRTAPIWSAGAPALTFRVAPPSVVRSSSSTTSRSRPPGSIGTGRAGVEHLSPWRWSLQSGSSPSRGRCSPRVATAACTSRSSTSGQGDAAFVRFPRGATLLVDAGGLSPLSTFDIGDRVVAPVLRAMGVRRLDVLALTHGDPDHIGGAPSLVREFQAAGGVGRHSGAAVRAAPRVASGRDRGRGEMVESEARRSDADRRRRGHRPPSGRAGLGAAAGPQRRLDRARAALARRLRAADRRHRPGGRTRRCCRRFRPRPCASSRSRTTAA